jgi:adenylate cyclase
MQQQKSYPLVLDLLVPVAVAAVFGGLALLPFFRGAENRVYDTLLHVKPAIAERPEIRLIDIDDTAIEKVGTFPWSRDIMADGLILMREMGARYAVFDIEYVDPSPRGVNADVLEHALPDALATEFTRASENASELVRAVRAGQIRGAAVDEYLAQLAAANDMGRRRLEERIRQIARDNDTYLGSAARFFGSAFLTVNMLRDPENVITDEHKSYVLSHIALPRATVKSPILRPDTPFRVTDVRPAILPVITGARGAGFPNVVVDGDGVRRRIDLVTEYQGKIFAQLGFRPLLDWLGDPQVIVERNRITLAGARHPDGATRDIVIPLTSDGRMLINWPRRTFIQSFEPHMTYWSLVQNKKLEENLVHNLRAMAEAGYLGYFSFPLLDAYSFAESIRDEVLAGGDPARIDEYIKVRAQFFAEATRMLGGDTEKAINAEIQAALAQKGIAKEVEQGYRGLLEDVKKFFAATREISGTLMASRSELVSKLKGAFCIIGWTGTSTTDIGVNPFEEEYMNVGTHAAVVNTILQGRFLDDLPWWVGAVAGLVLALIATLAVRRLSPLPSTLVGLAFLLVAGCAGVAFFVVTGVYPGILTPLLSVFFTFLTLTVVKFLRNEQEKAQIRDAFSRYLSPDVISEVLSDPGKLQLGGQERLLTAMFTDVKGFSTVSEQLTATDLVKLLNSYLTEMSNLILLQKGTIDKYEGDAIIAFFGAPVDLADHAARACTAAVRMKKVERILNSHFMEEGLSPTPLLTRIGINTGEMVVGNMGTDQKMDYTIMGSAVNLASRLEGVNKQYGTWILMSQRAYEAGGADFTVRRLDRVRVVGINEPVRLYELIDEKGQTTPAVREIVDVFEEGLTLFEQKDWEKARAAFQGVLKIAPEDGPSLLYEKRCIDNRTKPPAASWDGVFNLSVK